jgi:hypothetical protein
MKIVPARVLRRTARTARGAISTRNRPSPAPSITLATYCTSAYASIHSYPELPAWVRTWKSRSRPRPASESRQAGTKPSIQRSSAPLPVTRERPAGWHLTDTMKPTRLGRKPSRNWALPCFASIPLLLSSAPQRRNGLGQWTRSERSPDDGPAADRADELPLPG